MVQIWISFGSLFPKRHRQSRIVRFPNPLSSQACQKWNEASAHLSELYEMSAVSQKKGLTKVRREVIIFKRKEKIPNIFGELGFQLGVIWMVGEDRFLKLKSKLVLHPYLIHFQINSFFLEYLSKMYRALCRIEDCDRKYFFMKCLLRVNE